ncbi:hypothetical protein [Saccharopolyspora gregorii]|uniref:CDP-Glycerol:Poly(Glycerophosphate) glycerophosphotransferase n=1 Tax=Saccharopolyspora gregorii TaxID=33914 RepID=A0ABP6RU55_9PSEU
MGVLRWSELLAGSAGRSWRTVRVERSVLAIVHNVTAATRLLDILPFWAADHRIQTAFTCIGSSAFTTGTAEFLAAHDIIPLPWAEAMSQEFDLAVSASYGGPLHEVTAPLLVVPHGMGYNKTLAKPGNPESRKPVFGLSDEWLRHEGELIPSTTVLSHVEQVDRLREHCPEAVDVALVAGDPCFDRILASVPLREAYRRSFGVHPGQQLLFVSSTWGDSSLFGQDSSIVARLAARLPLDEYRIVVALHPNVWHGHSPWQVRMWLEDCARAGVVVLPPEEGWRAALIAADLTIGDHGSVTFYSAALGTPLLVTAAPEESLDPESPIARLNAAAPLLDPHRDLLAQLESTARSHRTERFAGVTELATSVPGESARLLRTAVYDWLELDEPDVPAEPVAVPLPDVDLPAPPGQLVSVEAGAGVELQVRRYPATPGSWPSGAGVVLVTGVRSPSRRMLELADVVLHEEPCTAPEQWARASLDALPGCLLAVVRTPEGRWLAVAQDGLAVVFSAAPDLGAVCGAVLHGWLRDRLVPSEFPRTVPVRSGDRRSTLGVSVQQG